MKMRGKSIIGLLLLLILLFILTTGTSFAQFKVYSWNNFEDGIFPQNLSHSHDATGQNTALVDYSTLSHLQGFMDNMSRMECGRFGMKFQTEVGDQFLKVVSNVTLNRKNLGQNGKALYQADIFLTADDKSIPYTVAILAALESDDPKKAKFSFYRFGIVKGQRVFFSFTHNTPEPLIYEQANIFDLKLKRPGWHRFQIIFIGQEEILCAIDGRAVEFSEPIKDSTLDKLKAGIMASSSEDKPVGICFADNLSIQWTTEDLALPDSPWIYRADGIQQAGYVNPFSPIMTRAKLSWLRSPEEAWRQASTQNKPLLILFYAPKVRSYKNLEQFINTNSAAQTLLKQFALLRIDVNQLRGGTLAQKFGVFKVPCFLVMDSKGSSQNKHYYRSEADWNMIAPGLQKYIGK